MLDGQIIKKTASDMAQYIRESAGLLAKSASELQSKMIENAQLRGQIAALSKRANAPAQPSFDEALLKKTASAICECYVGSSVVTPDDLAASFKQNPNAVLNVLQKLANEKLEATDTGSSVGVLTKSASAMPKPEVRSEADNRRETFWQAYRGE